MNCACFVPTLLVEFVNYLERTPEDVEGMSCLQHVLTIGEALMTCTCRQMCLGSTSNFRLNPCGTGSKGVYSEHKEHISSYFITFPLPFKLIWCHMASRSWSETFATRPLRFGYIPELRVHNLYGPTEASVGVSHFMVDSEPLGTT